MHQHPMAIPVQDAEGFLSCEKGNPMTEKIGKRSPRLKFTEPMWNYAVKETGREEGPRHSFYTKVKSASISDLTKLSRSKARMEANSRLQNSRRGPTGTRPSS